MGVLTTVLGLGRSAEKIGGAVGQVAEVFVPNRTKQMQQQHLEFTASLDQFAAEFAQSPSGWFDRIVNGLNRLPRPVLALGTVGLFIYAMWDPAGFSVRMRGLALVPEPLWWLLGAVVSFYFGARELHYHRSGRAPVPLAMAVPAQMAEGNAALDDWRAQAGPAAK